MTRKRSDSPAHAPASVVLPPDAHADVGMPPGSPPLFDSNAVGQLLCFEAAIVWPGDVKPVDIRIERGWPTRDGTFVVEWSFGLGDGLRHALFGVPSISGKDASSTPGGDGAPSARAIVTPQGIRGVLVHVPRWGVRIHSPDCDPDMPHLARCLDEREMAGRLAPYWPEDDEAGSSSDHHVECRPLGYRAGRRAAIAYESSAPTRPPRRIVGKTYRDTRGERLLRLHVALNEQVCLSSNGRVRVATPLGLLPDLRMVLFAWSDGRQVKAGCRSPADEVLAAVDALAVLHRVSIDGLPDFTVADECAVIDRWCGSLDCVAPRLAAIARSLSDPLHRAAEEVDTNQCCTLHRDFYECQLAYTPEVTTLLDLDTLARGNPSVDLGNMLAHLLLATLQSAPSPDGFSSLAAGVVRRYVEERGALDRYAFAFYWASALFRVGAVHSMRTTTKAYAPSLWRLSAELLRSIGFPPDLPAPTFESEAATPDLHPVIRELQS